MNYFKNKNNQVFAYDDEQLQLEEIQEKVKDLTPVTESEVEEFLNPPKTQEQLNAERVAKIDKRLEEIDKEAVRPTRSIKVAELQGKEPSKNDIDKLVKLEEEAQKLREERVEIAK